MLSERILEVAEFLVKSASEKIAEAKTLNRMHALEEAEIIFKEAELLNDALTIIMEILNKQAEEK